MIIIKIAILYFIQITHTDYFPSTGTRLVPIVVCRPTVCESISAELKLTFLLLLCKVLLRYIEQIYQVNMTKYGSFFVRIQQ